MTDKKRALDVWILETNTVYREVPFEIVTDWIQQGRLLPEDKARPAGKGGWYNLGVIPALAPYFPKPEPHRVEDEAEALEPVEVEVPTRRRRDLEEDDPDMIPLIDVTLVLLIFFMMTAAVEAGLFSPIDTPPAKHQLAAIGEGMYWVGIDKDTKGELRYSLGLGKEELRAPGPGIEGVLLSLGEQLKDVPGGEVRLRIRADKDLPIEVVREALRDLGRLEAEINLGRPLGQRIQIERLGEVSEPK